MPTSIWCASIARVGPWLAAGADDYITKPLDPDVLHVRLTIAERQVRSLERQKQRELDLMRDALRDPITDLPNRQLFLSFTHRIGDG